MVKFKFSTYHIVEISFPYIGICVHNLYFKSFSGFYSVFERCNKNIVTEARFYQLANLFIKIYYKYLYLKEQFGHVYNSMHWRD